MPPAPRPWRSHRLIFSTNPLGHIPMYIWYPIAVDSFDLSSIISTKSFPVFFRSSFCTLVPNSTELSCEMDPALVFYFFFNLHLSNLIHAEHVEQSQLIFYFLPFEVYHFVASTVVYRMSLYHPAREGSLVSNRQFWWLIQLASRDSRSYIFF